MGCARRSLTLLLALSSLASTADSVRAQDAGGSFEDESGKQRDFATTYAREIDPGHGEPDPVRAAVENVMLLGFGTIWYVAKPALNSVDWEFTEISQKLDPGAIRFDNNVFTTNMLLHPISGGGYYGFARLNNLGIGVSLAYAFVASALWEFAFEWREKVSINDMVMTPFGGMATGEPMYRLVDYVGSGPREVGWPQQTVRHTIGLPGTIHLWLDGPPPATHDSLPADRLGFSSAYAHDFRLGYGLALAAEVGGDADSELVHYMAFQTEIVALPGFLRPGRFHVWYDEGNFTEAAVRFGFAGGELVDSEVWLRTALAGYYAQDIAPQTRAGSAVSVALATAFVNQQRWLFGRREEIGVLHAIGPSADVWLLASRVQFHGRLESALDFAALRPAAYARFRELYPDGTVEAVLAEKGYDYYGGASARLRLSLTYGPFELGQRFGYGYYGALEGLDRYQEAVTRTTRATEHLIDYGTFLALAPPSLPFALQLELSTRLHAGQTEGVEAQREEHVMGAIASLRL